MLLPSNRRLPAALLALSSVLAISACSHAGSSLVPQASGGPASASYATMVISHPTHQVLTSNSLGSPVSPYAGAAIRAMVTTVPALIFQPGASTFDEDDGAIYLLDINPQTFASEVLRVTKTGATSLFATFAQSSLTGIAYDHADKTFYVNAAYAQNVSAPAVFSISNAGTVALVAGGTTTGSTDGSGSNASFTAPSGITVDGSDGALYVVDKDRIRRVTTAGDVTTFTPAGSIGLPNEVFPFSSPIAWNSSDGSFYVGDVAADVIRKISSAAVISMLAGFCVPSQNSFAPCVPLERNGNGTHAVFGSPSGIAVDASGVFIADTTNNAIRHVTFTGAVTTFAGNGRTANLDGAGLNAEFDAPQSVTIAGNRLFVADNDQSTRTAALRSATLVGSSPPPLKTAIALFDTITPGAQPYTLDWRAGTSPASNSLWYVDQTGLLANLSVTGTSTEYPDGVSPGSGNANGLDVVLGANGSPWLLDLLDGYIKNRATSGQIVNYHVNGYCCPFGNGPDFGAYGPDGNVWFLVNAQAVYVTPSGTVNYVNLPPNNFGYASIAFSRDGTLWVTTGNSILRLNLAGKVLGTYNYPAQFLTQSLDGNIAFTQSDAIGTINATTGQIVLYPIYEPIVGCPGCSRRIGAMVAGPDNAYWFVEQNTGSIGRLDPNGGFSEYPIYAARSNPYDISAGPDGNIWFVDAGSQKLGRVNLHRL